MEQGLGCDHVVFSRRDVLPVCRNGLPVCRNALPVCRDVLPISPSTAARMSQQRRSHAATRCPHVVMSCSCLASPLPVCRDGLPAERHGAALKAMGQVQASQAALPGLPFSVPGHR